MKEVENIEEASTMGRSKNANPNAMRNNNAKRMEERSHIAKFASYAEQEIDKLESHQIKK